MNVYVVHMCRWGELENHSYVLGVFTALSVAEGAAEDERAYRGGKYQGVIYEMPVEEEYERTDEHRIVSQPDDPHPLSGLDRTEHTIRAYRLLKERHNILEALLVKDRPATAQPEQETK